MKCVISVLGKDRSGIVAAVSRVLAECGANIDDISQTIMNKIFTMTMLVTLDPEVAGFNEVQEKLDAEGEELGVADHPPARGRLPVHVQDLVLLRWPSGRRSNSMPPFCGRRLDAVLCGRQQARCCVLWIAAGQMPLFVPSFCRAAERPGVAKRPGAESCHVRRSRRRSPASNSFRVVFSARALLFFAFISTFANRLSTTSFAGFVIGRVVETCAARRQKGVCGEGAKVCVPSLKKEGGRCAQAAGTHSRPRRPIG